MKTLFALFLSFLLSFSVLAQPRQGVIPPEVKTLADELKENLNISELLRDSRDDIVELERFKSREYKKGEWYHGLNPEMVPQLSDDEIADFIIAYNNAALVCFSYMQSLMPYVAARTKNSESALTPECFSFLDYFDDNMKIATEDELSDFMALAQTHSQELSGLARILTIVRYHEAVMYQYVESELNKYGMEVEGPFHEYVNSSEHGLRNLGRLWENTFQNIPGLKNADIYGFYISGLFAYVAFEQGEARIFMLTEY